MKTVAYDFGREIHILDLDEFDAHDGGPVTVLGTLPSGRTETVEAAGYRLIDTWTAQGEADGVTVELL